MKEDVTGVCVTHDVALDRKEWRRRTSPSRSAGWQVVEIKPRYITFWLAKNMLGKPKLVRYYTIRSSNRIA